MAPKFGTVNNPKGRPRQEDSAAAAIRKVLTDKHWDAATKTLFGIICIEVKDEKGNFVFMENPDSSGRDKSVAYNALADRAFGRPTQKLVHREDKSPPIDNIRLEELQRKILGDD